MAMVKAQRMAIGEDEVGSGSFSIVVHTLVLLIQALKSSRGQGRWAAPVVLWPAALLAVPCLQVWSTTTMATTSLGGANLWAVGLRCERLGLSH
jgi:hypothetical protein